MFAKAVFIAASLFLFSAWQCNAQPLKPNSLNKNSHTVLQGEVDMLGEACSDAGLKFDGRSTPCHISVVNYGSPGYYSGARKGDKVLSARVSDTTLFITIEREGHEYLARIPIRGTYFPSAIRQYSAHAEKTDSSPHQPEEKKSKWTVIVYDGSPVGYHPEQFWPTTQIYAWRAELRIKLTEELRKRENMLPKYVPPGAKWLKRAMVIVLPGGKVVDANEIDEFPFGDYNVSKPQMPSYDPRFTDAFVRAVNEASIQAQFTPGVEQYYLVNAIVLANTDATDLGQLATMPEYSHWFSGKGLTFDLVADATPKRVSFFQRLGVQP